MQESHQLPAAIGSRAKGTPELTHIHMAPPLTLANIRREKMAREEKALK